MADIALRVKQLIIEKTGIEETAITSEASFSKDLGVDSLDFVELLMEAEEEFGIAIPDEQMEKLTTVGSLIGYITGKCK